MKTTLTALAAVLTTLCIASTALGQTTPPASGDAPKSSVADIPQLYYSVTRDAAFAPWFITTPKDLNVQKGEDVRFKITYSGNPFPTVICMKNGRAIDYSAKRLDESLIYDVYSEGNWFVLIIREVVPEDSGLYQFTLMNSEGMAHASATLNVSKE